MYPIDANIFLEILLEQNKAGECQKLLNRLQESEDTLYVSTFTIHSIAVKLVKDGKLKELSEFLLDLSSSEIARIDTTTNDEIEVVKIVKKHNLDFDDALQLYLCKKHDLKIISYDQHFDKTPIERVEPSEVNF